MDVVDPEPVEFSRPTGRNAPTAGRSASTGNAPVKPSRSAAISRTLPRTMNHPITRTGISTREDARVKVPTG